MTEMEMNFNGNFEDFDGEDRIVSATYTADEDENEVSLRPRHLSEYIGQDKVKENLKIYIEAAKLRRELEQLKAQAAKGCSHPRSCGAVTCLFRCRQP